MSKQRERLLFHTGINMGRDFSHTNNPRKTERRTKKKDRRVAISTCIDPSMDRRNYDRRKTDRN